MRKIEYFVKETPKRIPTHPGFILKEDVLVNLGLSNTMAARELGVSRQALHRILKGAHPITLAMALHIGRFSGTNPAIWLKMQQAHDLKIAELELSEELKKIPVHMQPTH